jgi:DNA-binding beta-propeller fold protein YncE
MSADIAGQRLFIAALGNHSVEVADLKSARRIHSIPDLAEPQGVYFDAATNRLFVACAKDGAVKVFDGASFQLLGTAKLPENADNVRYDARGQRVVVGYGAGALALMDSSGKKTGEIPLDAHPESFQIEKNGTRVFVNVPDQKEIQVADLAANGTVAKWPMTSPSKNYPMSLDEWHRRLFIGCRQPARLVVIDTATGKQVAALETAGDSDDLFYDAVNGRIYVIGGQGFLDIFEQKDPDHYVRAAHLPTAPGARTGLFVPEWERLFVAVPHRGEQKAGVLVFDTR